MRLMLPARRVLVALTVLALTAGTALAPRPAAAALLNLTWVQYWQADNRCWYAVESIRRSGSEVIAKWTCDDDAGEWYVFTTRLRCGARTLESLAAEVYNQSTGAYIRGADMSGTTPLAVQPNSMGALLLQRLC
jgi:hypothetical protein